MNIPNDYRALINYWEKNFETLVLQYQHQQQWSFIPGLLPEQALRMPNKLLLSILKKRFGSTLHKALQPENTIKSPVANASNTNWLKTVNMVGINVRTINNFWNILKYILTIPDTQSSIHLLPIWEPGVVSSLYGISSWNINTEFFSDELEQIYPHLDTVEKQLKVVINLLHAMGRTVGMDVIPHCDRYAEMVLANPSYFEWLLRRDMQIVKHNADLHLQVEEHIFMYIKIFGSAAKDIGFPKTARAFYSPNFSEINRLKVLFGRIQDAKKREQRRERLVQHLYDEGYETVPATMAPPYRGLAVDKSPNGLTVDVHGRIWRDYKITQPQQMSRVFGPLTRFKLYERLNDNENWEIDFSKPRKEVWDYVCQKYNAIQSLYNFDFMRGDMSHVQMRPSGVPEQTKDYYDIHQEVKKYIQQQKHYFAYFAESFIAPENLMAYGDELDHLEMSDADTTLGNLQSMVVGTPEFIQTLRYYRDILETRHFVPSMTIMTADKDDPRFDKFYIDGNEARLFMAFFLTDMPSYMGLGFETRDRHLMPAPNEYYTKLYVFHILKGPKATRGPYIWGKNGALFRNLTRIRIFAQQLLPEINHKKIKWLLSPDATGHKKIIAWTIEAYNKYIFTVNLDLNLDAINIKIPLKIKPQQTTAQLTFSSYPNEIYFDNVLKYNGKSFHLNSLRKGEARVYFIKTK